jgi:DNA-binding NtrC family response regulator
MSEQKKILICDDEVEVGQLLYDFFEDQGYKALLAHDPRTALKIVDAESPDVIFLDVVMPEMDGLECLKRIMSVRPESIVIIMSGLQDEQIAKDAIQGGAYDYIVKPFDLAFIRDNLLNRIFSN